MVNQKMVQEKKIRLMIWYQWNYNISINSWLQDNDIEIYLINYNGKSLVDERFMKNLKNKICKCLTGIWKKVYTHKN